MKMNLFALVGVITNKQIMKKHITNYLLVITPTMAQPYFFTNFNVQ